MNRFRCQCHISTENNTVKVLRGLTNTDLFKKGLKRRIFFLTTISILESFIGMEYFVLKNNDDLKRYVKNQRRKFVNLDRLPFRIELTWAPLNCTCVSNSIVCKKGKGGAKFSTYIKIITETVKMGWW